MKFGTCIINPIVSIISLRPTFKTTPNSPYTIWAVSMATKIKVTQIPNFFISFESSFKKKQKTLLQLTLKMTL